jgi:hypothetical protein
LVPTVSTQIPRVCHHLYDDVATRGLGHQHHLLAHTSFRYRFNVVIFFVSQNFALAGFPSGSPGAVFFFFFFGKGVVVKEDDEGGGATMATTTILNTIPIPTTTRTNGRAKSRAMSRVMRRATIRATRRATTRATTSGTVLNRGIISIGTAVINTRTDTSAAVFPLRMSILDMRRARPRWKRRYLRSRVSQCRAGIWARGK